MALDSISHYFDEFRQRGLEGEKILNLIKESVSESLKKSTLGEYSTYDELPEDDFTNWLEILFDHKGVSGLTDNQRKEIHRQLSDRLETIDTKTCSACWRYWLRLDLKPVSALFIVDIQNDFISGSLALKHCPAGEDGEEIVPIIKHLLSQNLFPVVGYSFDWHPSNHCSFLDNVSLYPLHRSSLVSQEHAKLFDTVIYDRMPLTPQKLWPRHCVMDSWGAELHKDMQKPGSDDIIIKKGTHPLVDTYSAFRASGTQDALFIKLLDHQVTDVYICGLAFDVCVKETALDSVKQGFRTHVIVDACKGVTAEGISDTKQIFEKNGVILLHSDEVKDAIR